MKKKVILGISLIVLFFSFLFFLFFNLSPDKNLIEKKKQLETIDKKNVEMEEERIESSNIIEDVSYSAKDTKGNVYFLKASEGTIDQNESNYIFLKSVKANINLKNYELIEISSDFGKYNINNYDTIFSKNVIITYLDNIIMGNYLDFSWNKNLMIISKNVIFKNEKGSVKADVVEVNIKSKNIKIFMYEENKKVKMRSLN
tara:strand:+ start:1000 stop:1602 length:603 start_codon:yes stop_codon:yes gene_type:complete